MVEKNLHDELPVEFSSCPNCGSTRRLGEEIQKMQPSSSMPVGAKIALNQQIIPLAQSLLTGKVLVIVSDICIDCGTHYAILIGEHQGHIEIRQVKG